MKDFQWQNLQNNFLKRKKLIHINSQKCKNNVYNYYLLLNFQEKKKKFFNILNIFFLEF